ncbi:MAG: hypothetical protein NXI04_08020 [Planctomycetaceae bacterium]|nr:hypothetical protein [Planctomycetaceae bacterium]
MAKSKTDIIKEYLAANPEAKGKDAAAALKKHGITAQYFYVIKSNLSKGKKPAKKRVKKKAAKKKVVRRKIGSAVEVSVEELQTAAEFAARFGGLDKLSAAITALRQFQVN